jgi:hypothetical protein
MIIIWIVINESTPKSDCEMLARVHVFQRGVGESEMEAVSSLWSLLSASIFE